MTAGPEGSSTQAGFTALREDVIYESWITLSKVHMRAPDGSEFAREVLHHPGAVSIVPVLDDGDTVLLVRQYRAAVGDYLVEIPAGKRDVPGEDPLTTAHRELEEEVGMRAGRMELLCDFFNAPGFCDEHQYVFLARDLSPVQLSSQSIEEEHMTVQEARLSELPSLMKSAVIRDAKTIIGLLLARDRVARGA